MQIINTCPRIPELPAIWECLSSALSPDTRHRHTSRRTSHWYVHHLLSDVPVRLYDRPNCEGGANRMAGHCRAREASRAWRAVQSRASVYLASSAYPLLLQAPPAACLLHVFVSACNVELTDGWHSRRSTAAHGPRSALEIGILPRLATARETCMAAAFWCWECRAVLLPLHMDDTLPKYLASGTSTEYSCERPETPREGPADVSCIGRGAPKAPN